MRILVIGATGQIGYALTAALARTDHAVSVLVRSSSQLGFPGHVRVIRSANFDAQAFATALVGVDHLIYALGLPEQFVFDDGVFERVNLDLLRLCLDQLPDTVRHLTYFSTYEVFRAVDGIIRETHPVADARHTTPYFRAMIQAFQFVSGFAQANPLQLTTLHPAAVYGGRNTSQGFTNYIENLLRRRFWRVPFIFPSRFPVVHAQSLADAALRALNVPGRFIVSDQMTSLETIASSLRQLAPSYVPIVAPTGVARLGAQALQALSRVTRRPPLMASVQIEFVTKGWEPKADRAVGLLGWQPLPLSEGLRRYLHDRRAPSREARP